MKSFLNKKYHGVSYMTIACLLLVGVGMLVFQDAEAIAGVLPFLGAGMILDARAEFCDATAVNTGGVASYLLGNVYDTGAVSKDIGQGQPVYLVITVDTAIASATGSFKFKLCSDAQAAIAVDGTQTIHFSTGAFLEGALTAGTRVCCVALPMGAVYERYIGIVQETITAAATAGKINAFLTMDPTGWRAYPDGI